MIEIRPQTTAKLDVRMPGQNVTIDTSNGPAMMRALKDQAPGQIRVYLAAGGYTLDADNENEALKLAGLYSFAAAKQTSKGYIEF